MSRADNYDPVRRWGCSLLVLLCVLAAGGCAALLCGCSPRTVHVPMETVRTEYRDRDVHLFSTDSVNNTQFVFVKGDTVVCLQEKERIRRVEVHDTIKVILTDTIRVPYPVERALSRWEQTKMDFGGMALGGIAVALCIAVVWLIRKFRR